MAVLCGVALPFAWFGLANKGNRSDDVPWRSAGASERDGLHISAEL